MLKRNMELNRPFIYKSLKEHVYDFLREQLSRGNILPGSLINLEKTARELGVSKTPLRDALLQLEMEGFVRIIPRRGVVVNVLTLKDIKDFYQIIGSLEALAVLVSYPKMKTLQLKEMERLNKEMKLALDKDNFDLYYEKNLKFHNTYLNLCDNKHLIKIVNTLKKRLYDFPRQKGYLKEWEENSIKEHQEFLKLLKEAKPKQAAEFMRDVHWSFDIQKKYIVKYYPLEEYQNKLREFLGEKHQEERIG